MEWQSLLMSAMLAIAFYVTQDNRGFWCQRQIDKFLDKRIEGIFK